MVPPATGRITRRSDFDLLRHSPHRARSGPVRATYVALPSGPPFPLVGYAVARRCGNAVARNRLRRRIRAVAAEAAPALRPGAYLISPGPEASGLDHPELSVAVRRAMTEAAAEAAE